MKLTIKPINDNGVIYWRDLKVGEWITHSERFLVCKTSETTGLMLVDEICRLMPYGEGDYHSGAQRVKIEEIIVHKVATR